MNIFRLIFSSSFLLLSACLFGQQQNSIIHFDMIPAGDPVLEDIRFISMETGKAFLSFTPPLAPAEVKIFLDSIDESELSQNAADAYFRILNRLSINAPPLSYSIGLFSVFVNANAALEGKVKFNSDISWYPLYSEVPAFISVPINIYFSDIIQLYVEPSYTIRNTAYNSGSAGVNIPTKYDSYNDDMPLRAYIALGGSFWNFQLGRDRLYWGTAHSGSLSFSGNSEFFDFARFSLFSSIFKYSFIINQMPLFLEKELFTEEFIDWNAPDNLMRTTERYFYLHRIDIKLFNILSIGIMEGVLAGNSSLEIRYLNPLVIFHGFFSWGDYDNWYKGDDPAPDDEDYMNGSFLAVEINLNIIKNLSIYAQFIMNDLTSWDEQKMASDRIRPNGLGFLAGVQYSHSINSWGALYYIEFIHTDPYLYMLSSPYASFIQMNTNRNYYYLGYPRDTIALILGAVFFDRDILNFSGNFSWIASGSHSRLVWDWKRGADAYNEKTPTGTVEHKFILSLAAQWKFLSFLVFKAELTGVFSHNNNNKKDNNQFGGQTKLSVNFQY